MAPMNLFEKIDKVIATMNTTTLVMMLLLSVLLSVMFIFSEKNKKYSYISYILVLVFVGFAFKNSLFKLIDMFIERLFYLFYFPTGAIYMITLVVSHIVFLQSLGNKKMDKLTKNVNFVGFSFMQVLCISILNYLSTSSLDLTNELNFVGDKTMIGILELSMLVFILWMGSLVVMTMIRKMTNVVLARELSEVPKVVVVEEPTVESVPSTPVLKPLFNRMVETVGEKWNALKEVKPQPMFKPQQAVVNPDPMVKPEPVMTQMKPVEMIAEKPKMTQELMDRLLRPEPMMMKEKTLQVAEPKTTTVSVPTEPVMSWSNAVIEALHIPSEPIYNDVEEPFMNRIVETVPEEPTVVEENITETKEQSTEGHTKAFDLCQLLLRKQEDPGHSLEDYLELRKYLVAEK